MTSPESEQRLMNQEKSGFDSVGFCLIQAALPYPGGGQFER
jgi:hypothetical protein